MKVYSTSTPDFLDAAQRWLASSVREVEPGCELTIEIFGEIRGCSDFLSPTFIEHYVEKNRRVVSWIRENEGQSIFVTDCDVIYVKPFLRRLEQEVEGADIAFAREGVFGEYNIGQMVIRCSEATANFFEEIGRCLGGDAWDQQEVNRLIGSAGLRHRGLSPRFCNSAIWDRMTVSERRSVFSYHATDTKPTSEKSSLVLKQERIDAVLSVI